MTIEEICDSEGVTLAYFDNDLWKRPGMIISDMKIIFVNKSLTRESQERVILHELGHKEHTPAQYELNREYCELQADRSMIHHLLEEELQLMEDVRDFNYIKFMEEYKLKTIADETMVKDEYNSLIS